MELAAIDGGFTRGGLRVRNLDAEMGGDERLVRRAELARNLVLMQKPTATNDIYE